MLLFSRWNIFSFLNRLTVSNKLKFFSPCKHEKYTFFFSSCKHEKYTFLQGEYISHTKSFHFFNDFPVDRFPPKLSGPVKLKFPIDSKKPEVSILFCFWQIVAKNLLAFLTLLFLTFLEIAKIFFNVVFRKRMII